jgi:hypothetical protein
MKNGFADNLRVAHWQHNVHIALSLGHVPANDEGPLTLPNLAYNGYNRLAILSEGLLVNPLLNCPSLVGPPRASGWAAGRLVRRAGGTGRVERAERG